MSTSYYPEYYQISKLLFSGISGDFLIKHIEITDALVKHGYTRKDIMIMPFWELKEIIRIKNEKANRSDDRDYLVK